MHGEFFFEVSLGPKTGVVSPQLAFPLEWSNFFSRFHGCVPGSSCAEWMMFGGADLSTIQHPNWKNAAILCFLNVSLPIFPYKSSTSLKSFQPFDQTQIQQQHTHFAWPKRDMPPPDLGWHRMLWFQVAFQTTKQWKTMTHNNWKNYTFKMQTQDESEAQILTGTHSRSSWFLGSSPD